MVKFLLRKRSGFAAAVLWGAGLWGAVLLGAQSGVGAQQTVPARTGVAAQSGRATGYTAPTLTVNARIVALDVVVTDKKGRVVDRQLSKDDFKVLDDGVPQTIQTFEPPSDHRMPVSAVNGVALVKSAADLKKIGNAPVTIVVLDELDSQSTDMSYARQMLVKYLESEPPVLRQPTVLMVAENTRFQQLHDYTQDRDALIQAVKKHMPEIPWRMMNSGKTGSGAVERMAQVLAALQQIAQASMGTPGRKNLVWVGNGFPSADLVTLPHDEGDAIEAAVRRATNMLLAARVTVYTIDPIAESSETVEADTPEDLDAALDSNGGDPFGGTINFGQLAPATGGIAFAGRNDLNNEIGQGIAAGQYYYTLSYSPTDKSEDPAKFRHIKVVMADPNLRAYTRDGYFPETGADLNPVTDKAMQGKQVRANLQLDLSAALTTAIAYDGLAVTAEKTGKGEYAIRVAEQGIGWSGAGAGGQQHEEATVAAAWYDAKGRLLGHVAREEVSVRGAEGAGATFDLPVTLPGDAKRLRFVVRDALNGNMGTVDLKGKE